MQRAAEAAAVAEERRRKAAAKAAARKQFQKAGAAALWPGAAAKGEREGDHWLCLAMCGAGLIIALILALALVFTLQPGSGAARSGDLLALAFASDPSAPAPAPAADEGHEGPRVHGDGGCTGACEYVVCTATAHAGGVPDALRGYFNSSQWGEACAEGGGGGGGVRVAVRGGRFPGDALGGGGGGGGGAWTEALAATRVAELQLVACALREVLPGAFDAPPFAATHALALIANRIQHLRAGAFRGLTALKILVINRNPALITISADVLLPVAPALRALTVQRSLNDPRHVTNLTGLVRLPLLQNVDLDYNTLDTLEQNAFDGLANVHSISLRSSNLKTVRESVLDSVAGSLRQLFLDNNELRALPRNIFDSVMSGFRMGLIGNPWDCSCSTSYFRDILMSPKINISYPYPLCATPPRNAFIPLHKATFCEDDENDPLSGEVDTEVFLSLLNPHVVHVPVYNSSRNSLKPNESHTTEDNSMKIQIHCDDFGSQRKNITVYRNPSRTVPFSQDGASINVPLQENVFSVTRIEDDTVEISIPANRDEEVLYWYPQNATESRGDLSDSGCHVVNNDSMTVGQLRARQVYVLCLVNASDPQRASGLQCLSVQTAAEPVSAESVALGGTQRWYIVVIAVLIVLLVALTLYVTYGFLFRRVRSSKREQPRPPSPPQRHRRSTQLESGDIFMISRCK